MRAVTVLLSLFLTFSALAGELVIPAVFRGPGAGGSVWRSEIAIANISPPPAFPAHVNVTLHRDGLEPVAIPLILTQHENLLIADAVWAWFGLETGGGLVRITWEGETTRISARARSIEKTVYPYASVVRSDTGDATFIIPSR
jgi:hypothetical protein